MTPPQPNAGSPSPVTGAGLSRAVLAILGPLLFAGPAWATSSDCNTVEKMAHCCAYFEKAQTTTVYQWEADLAHECSNELDGALDQSRQEKQLNVCIPENTAMKDLSFIFRTFAENNPQFWTRLPRFGLLYVWGLKWPCEK
jgi:hypothetical protein